MGKVCSATRVKRLTQKRLILNILFHLLKMITKINCFEDELFVKFEMGMAYNPLTKNWCWSKDNSVNFALYAQKFVTNTNKN